MSDPRGDGIVLNAFDNADHGSGKPMLVDFIAELVRQPALPRNIFRGRSAGGENAVHEKDVLMPQADATNMACPPRHLRGKLMQPARFR
jgi:hypothetical protein